MSAGYFNVASFATMYSLALIFFLVKFFFQQPDAGFEFFNRRQLVLDLFHLDIVVGCDSHRCLDSFERVLNFRFVFIAADEQTDGRILGGCLNQVIHGVYIEIELAGEFRLERNRFEFDHNVAVERDVEEEHVQFPCLSCHDNLLLPAQVSESCSECQKEVGEMLFQLSLQFFFLVAFFMDTKPKS